MKFAKRLKELRVQHGFTQQEMAELLNTTNQNYGRFETQNANPKLATLIKMAQIFGVSVDYLLGVDEPAQSSEEERLASAVYWSKQLAPDFKLEYRDGYYYLTALQDIETPVEDIKAGSDFKMSIKLLQAITYEIERAIKTERQKVAQQTFKTTAIQSKLFQLAYDVEFNNANPPKFKEMINKFDKVKG